MLLRLRGWLRVSLLELELELELQLVGQAILLRPRFWLPSLAVLLAPLARLSLPAGWFARESQSVRLALGGLLGRLLGLL